MLIPSALMAPFYRGWEPNLQLNRDDSEAIQALYGKTKQNIDDPPAEASLTTTTSTTTQRPSVDEPTSPQVPETSGAGQHYFFWIYLLPTGKKNSKMWLSTGVLKGSEKDREILVSMYWGIPPNIHRSHYVFLMETTENWISKKTVKTKFKKSF